jgi:regulator of RNase E activity RraA
MPKRLENSVLDALAAYDSATVQNAAILVRGFVPEYDDYSGPELKCMLPEFGVLAGYAVTAELFPLHNQPDATGWDDYYDSIAYAKAPTIAVLKDIDYPQSRGAIFGDGMAYRHRALGCLGAVVDGSVRDVEGIRKAKCGLWGRSRVPGHGPFGIVKHGEPVNVAGLLVRPGDILVCDSDGVTRVPPEIALDVAKKCAEVRKKESEMHRYFSAPGFTVKKYKAWKAEQAKKR